jgi:hypothetical protein
MSLPKSCSWAAWAACLGTLALAHGVRADGLPAAANAPAPQSDSDPDPSPPPVAQALPPPAAEPVYHSAPYAEPVEHEMPTAYSYAWSDPKFKSEIGIGFSIGGGVNGFPSQAMRDTASSSVGGLWDVRTVLGTRIPIAIELGYVGTATSINTFTGANNGTLVGTAFEALVRWNILPHAALTPYVFGGVGYQRYDVNNIQFSQADSGMKSNDNLAEFPVGTGVSLRDLNGFTVDVRGTFCPTTDSHLLLDQTTGDFARLNTWEASAIVGYEF